MELAKLVLQNGKIYTGTIFSKGDFISGELIFNTAMSGYEEVLTDPSYYGQMVLMTYPLVGNYGINENNIQSDKLHLKALIVKEYIDFPSNWESKKSLKTYLEENNIIGIEGIDTRAITRDLRTVGAMNALITTSNEPDNVLIEKVKKIEDISGKNLAKEVSTKKIYKLNCNSSIETHYNVAVIDCGVKKSILNQLLNLGCNITVFPYNVSSSELLQYSFDGVLVSNGPGDPSAVTETITLVKEIIGKLPLFGICLGHQILCCAFNFEMEKLTFGHHGINHPIKNMLTQQVEISSQNHIYCAKKDSIPDNFFVSHVNLNDNTVAGIQSDELMAFSVQYHPESAPGPNDSNYLFQEFKYLMKHQNFKHSQKMLIETKG